MLGAPIPEKRVLGVIGGSGLYNIAGARIVAEHDISTPYGKPSDPIAEIELPSGQRAFFLSRHGVGHRLSPSEVNYRANIYALRSLGVRQVLSVCAVGSMVEDLKPGHFVIPNQLFDRTTGKRDSSFFEGGLVGHVSLADPFCPSLRPLLADAVEDLGFPCHQGGCLVVMEGPQFSTRAESHFYRKTLAPVAIGMTALPEAKLAREAEMCYFLLGVATDYDCWREDEKPVEAGDVIELLNQHSQRAPQIIDRLLTSLPETSICSCLSSAKHAFASDVSKVPEASKTRLKLLYDKYLQGRW